jgi:hypothetical protein
MEYKNHEFCIYYRLVIGINVNVFLQTVQSKLKTGMVEDTKLLGNHLVKI